MKYFSLILLLLIAHLSIAQNKSAYLENNRYDLSEPNFQFPETSFKILGFGAYHGAQKTEEVELVLIKSLLSNRVIKYYLPETDFAIAFYFNEFLQNGDTVLLRDLVKHYGRRVPQDASIATYEKWRKLKVLNDQLPENERLQVIGIDLLVSYKYVAKLLLELLPFQSGRYASYDELVQLVKRDTADFSPDYDSYSKGLMKRFVQDYESSKPDFNALAKDKFIVEHLISNIKLTFEKRDREKTMFDNHKVLNARYDFANQAQFLRMGFFHIEKEREGNYPSFFARLIESGTYSRQEVLSVIGYLTESRVLWSSNFDQDGNYLGYNTEGGYGIGDYWKEYFKGIGKLKMSALSDMTLFRLNGAKSPYQEGVSDLMEIKLFLQKSNHKALKGKTTTDYLDYAILISDSKASIPIHELKP